MIAVTSRNQKKRKKMKPKVNRRKQTTKIRGEINETEAKKKRKKSVKLRVSSLKR